MKQNPIRDVLHERFPRCFVGRGDPAKHPLAIGIKQQIAAACPDLTLEQIGMALGDYCGGPTYHRACSTGAYRVGLDGNVIGVMTDAQAGYHRQRLRLLEQSWRRRDRKPAAQQKEAMAS